MEAFPPIADGQEARRAITGSSEMGSKPPASGEEAFLRFVVVIIGMLIGAVAAFIIGLATGWIPFEC